MNNHRLEIRRSNAALLSDTRGLVLPILIIFAAFMLGLAAATGSLVLAALVAGLIGGGFLLARPVAAITGIIGIGLTMGALLAIAGREFEKLAWAVSLLGFFLLIPSILQLTERRRAPTFVNLAIVFAIVSLGTTLAQWTSTGEVLRGIKHTHQALGLLLALALLHLTENDFRRWRKLMILVVALQLPFALYEFLILVPRRGGLTAGSETTDVVAGTFGANIIGGSPNSVMALLLLIALAFVSAHWRMGLLKSRYLLVIVPSLLLPIGLGEVRITFILLPMLMLILFWSDIIRRPGVFVGAFAVSAATIIALGLIYIQFILNKPLDDIIDRTIAYNFQNLGYGGYILNRSTVLSFWWHQQGMHDPVGFLFGNGLGSSFTGNEMSKIGHVAEKWPSHGVGLTTASSLLWDTGMVGLVLYISVFVAAWKCCSALLILTISKYHRAEVSALRASLPLFVIFIFYNDALMRAIAMQILSAVTLGYVAFLYYLLRPFASKDIGSYQGRLSGSAGEAVRV